MIERSIRSERGETYYWISRTPQAEAKTLVFTHGAAVDHTMFEKQVEYFKSSCTVIVWDIPL
ncbi:MAG: alpha/beta hydrolase, partial [Peptococcaceae bacterium]|nr:alpha/beta hydrolase [Peptococcaceae bacterium]